MKSKPNNEPKVSIIFGQLSSYELHNILENHGATKKETKAVFLMRDVASGLINVSYYSQEDDMVKHLRLGLTIEGWKIVPKPPKKPIFTDTLDVKTKYLQDKAKFDEEMQHFFNTAKTLFEQNITPELLKTLGAELRNHEFDLKGLIRPTREEASQEKHYFDYIGEILATEVIYESNKSNKVV